MSYLKYPNTILGGLLSSTLGIPKRKVFISYHHDIDQLYYKEFSRLFDEYYDVIQDNSLDRLIDSDDADYVMRRIREKHITGSSCTIVLCGAETSNRKYVDWEIKATLDKEHGLIGVNLPTNPRNALGQVYVPERLSDNINSAYAIWMNWGQFVGDPRAFMASIELANTKPKNLINNNRPLRARNG